MSWGRGAGERNSCIKTHREQNNLFLNLYYLDTRQHGQIWVGF